MTAGVFRGFVSVPLSPCIRAFLQDFTSEARQALSEWRFVSTDNLHITLQFLGNHVQRAMIPEILKVIAQSVTGIAPFDLFMGSASAFPGRGRPRVLYVGAGQGNDNAAKLAGSVRSGLSTLGFEENKPFQAHVTLARRKRGACPANKRAKVFNERGIWEAMFSQFKGKCLAESNHTGLHWRVSEVLLMESTLYPQGPVYSALGRVPLLSRQ
ncbi:MAG TPA: RNA 2',3'-cyclic phosphodiesterase [Firmicutes bacterium]|nr:RNA 2',3'-cyclic phosphodiesterase [Candidatus Fermentithermobacillaceae bacterium]